jgi:hypothetical protein
MCCSREELGSNYLVEGARKIGDDPRLYIKESWSMGNDAFRQRIMVRYLSRQLRKMG